MPVLLPSTLLLASRSALLLKIFTWNTEPLGIEFIYTFSQGWDANKLKKKEAPCPTILLLTT